jgi:hypothetical protein
LRHKSPQFTEKIHPLQGIYRGTRFAEVGSGPNDRET